MRFAEKLDEWGPMTVLMIVVVAVVLGVGGAVVITAPDTLSFEQYLDQLKTFALAIAGLAGARGIVAASHTVAEGKVQAAALTAPAYPHPPEHTHPPVSDVGARGDVASALDIDAYAAAGEDLPDDDEEFGDPEADLYDSHELDDEDGADYASALDGAGTMPDDPDRDAR